MHGIIDNAKTAKLMVKDESLDVVRRYENACVNCLEDEARELIKSIPEDRRREYNMNRVLDFGRIGYNYFIVFFTCTLSGDVDQLNVCFQQILARGVSINHYLFSRSLVSYNPAKNECFFNKLNQEEREFSLGKMASNCVNYPVFTVVFYSSRMNAEQQTRIFRECIGNVLVRLLNWPMQSLFMAAAEYGRRYMVHGDYEKVIGAVTRKISDEVQDYDYYQLFRECWSLTPTEDKLLLLDNAGFLEKIFKTKREDFIKLILNKAHAHQLLALSNNFHEKCQMLLEEGVISDAALVKCKQTAAMKSSKNERDVEKRLRSEHLNQFVDIAIEERSKIRRLV